MPKNKQKSEWEKRFDEWAEETTAIYISDDEDEHSITFDELPKYENLKQFIAQEKQRSWNECCNKISRWTKGKKVTKDKLRELLNKLKQDEKEKD